MFLWPLDGNVPPVMDERPHQPRRELGDTHQAGVAPVRRAAAAIRGIVPAVARFSRGLRRLALAALAGGAVVWWALAARVLTGTGRVIALAVWAVVLLAPPAMLVVVSSALLQILKIPDRLAAIPTEAGQRAGEVRRLAGEARQARQRGWVRSAVSVIRLWRRAAGSREILEVAGPVAFVFNLWTLFLSLVAMAGAFVEIVAGVAMLLWVLTGAR
jgi:hypothetical protein